MFHSEEGEDGCTVSNNARLTGDQRAAEIVEGNIDDQAAHDQQQNGKNKVWFNIL